MDRLTRKSVGVFQYALKDHVPVVGEFGTYEAFFDYSMAVKKLGEYEDMEIGNCKGCIYGALTRPQKCSCCRRNPHLKDCYDGGNG